MHQKWRQFAHESAPAPTVQQKPSDKYSWRMHGLCLVVRALVRLIRGCACPQSFHRLGAACRTPSLCLNGHVERLHHCRLIYVAICGEQFEAVEVDFPKQVMAFEDRSDQVQQLRGKVTAILSVLGLVWSFRTSRCLWSPASSWEQLWLVQPLSGLISWVPAGLSSIEPNQPWAPRGSNAGAEVSLTNSQRARSAAVLGPPHSWHLRRQTAKLSARPETPPPLHHLPSTTAAASRPVHLCFDFGRISGSSRSLFRTTRTRCSNGRPPIGYSIRLSITQSHSGTLSLPPGVSFTSQSWNLPLDLPPSTLSQILHPSAAAPALLQPSASRSTCGVPSTCPVDVDIVRASVAYTLVSSGAFPPST